jgi:hypothetical protein
MRRELFIGLLCGGLGACGVPRPEVLPRVSLEPPPAAAVAQGDLHSARLACNTAYPAQIGNYAPHASCVNAAVERYALAGAPYPDLIQLQEQLRVQISARIDSKAISPQAGERQMAEADRAIDAAEQARNAAHPEAANQQITRLQTMVQE